MSVYVDDFKSPYGRMVMCHMSADSREELDAMADEIGVDRKWIQNPGGRHEHYDICMAKRKLAVESGAIEVTARQAVLKMMERAKRP